MSAATNARVRQISARAYQGKAADSSEWDLSDLKLYHALRLLYAEYGMCLVDADQAARERLQLVRAWEREKVLMEEKQ